MDILVFKKFDFRKRTILRNAEEEITQFKGQLASKGVVRSSLMVIGVAKILVRSAEATIDALLDTYVEVGRATEEEIVVLKEQEIKQEVENLSASEGQRIQNGISDIAKTINMGIPQEYSSAWSNLVIDSRQKAEILIETHKRRINNRKPRKSFSEETFVIMQIGNVELDKIWSDVYAPVIQDLKLKPRRIDKHNEGRFLMSEVADLLNRSKVVIADLTNERPNCYLEVGYALGIEKFSHLILTAKEDHNPDSPNYQKNGPKIHFDINGYDIIFWDPKNIEEFKLKLAQRIKYRLTVIEENAVREVGV